MLARIWLVLLALLLVAAPATDVSAEIVDEQVNVTGEEIEVLYAAVPPVAAEPGRAPALTDRDARVPMAPVAPGVFRPPRCTFE